MSHFTTVAVQITNIEDLKTCLKEMGYIILDVKVVRGYGNSKQVVDLAIKPTADSYPIGFRKLPTGEFEVVADWWGVHSIKEKEFMGKLKSTFAEEKISKFAQRNRYTVKRSTVNQETVLELVRRTY